MNVLAGIENMHIKYTENDLAIENIRLELIKLENMNNNPEELILGLEALMFQITKLGDVPGLESILSKLVRVLLGLVDSILGMINNAGGLLQSVVVAVPRSELEAKLDSHMMKYNTLKNSNDYRTISKISLPTFPFRVSPKEVSEKIGLMLISTNMKVRMKNIIDVLNMFNDTLRNGNPNKSVSIMGELHVLTNKDYCNKSLLELTKIVLPKIEVNYENFGDRYHSIREFTDVVGMTLMNKNELNTLVVVHDLSKKLYKSMENTRSILSNMASNDVEMEKFRKLPIVLFDIGMLIKIYAMMVKEYHHLEHNLASAVSILVVNQF